MTNLRWTNCNQCNCFTIIEIKHHPKHFQNSLISIVLHFSWHAQLHYGKSKTIENGILEMAEIWTLLWVNERQMVKMQQMWSTMKCFYILLLMQHSKHVFFAWSNCKCFLASEWILMCTIKVHLVFLFCVSSIWHAMQMWEFTMKFLHCNFHCTMGQCKLLSKRQIFNSHLHSLKNTNFLIFCKKQWLTKWKPLKTKAMKFQ